MFWPQLQQPSGNSSSFRKDFTTRLTPRALRAVGKRWGQRGVCPYTSVPSSPGQLRLYQGWQPQHSANNSKVQSRKKHWPETHQAKVPATTSCFWMDLKSSWRFLFNNNVILKLRNALSSQHILGTSDNNDLTTTLGISLEKSWSSPSSSPHHRAQGPREEMRMLGSSRHTAPTWLCPAAGLFFPRDPQLTGLPFRKGENKREPRCARPWFEWQQGWACFVPLDL